MSKTIYTLDQIVEAAAVAPMLSGVHIYQGFVEPDSKQAVKVATWKPREDDTGRNFGAGPDVFGRSTFGNFTAIFKPGGEFLYFSNARPGAENLPEFMNQEKFNVTGIDVNELLATAVEREKRISELEAEIENLREELQEQTDNEQKFQRAVFNTLDYFTRQKLNIQRPFSGPIQGSKQNETMTQEDELENAVALIIDAFGEDWLIRFAGHIAANPNTINQVKSFFP
jgi:hypothetical protein